MSAAMAAAAASSSSAAAASAGSPLLERKSASTPPPPPPPNPGKENAGSVSSQSSPARYKINRQNKKLVATRSSPQLMLNQIHEEEVRLITALKSVMCSLPSLLGIDLQISGAGLVNFVFTKWLHPTYAGH